MNAAIPAGGGRSAWRLRPRDKVVFASLVTRNGRRFSRLLWSLGCAAWLPACTGFVSAPGGSSCRSLWKAHLEGRSRSEALDASRRLPVEERYELYYCATRVVHPPIIGFSSLIAERGHEAIPSLRRRLGLSRDDHEIVDLMRITMYMTMFETYDVRSDAELMGALIGAKERLEDETWRRMAEEMLDRIGLEGNVGRPETKKVPEAAPEGPAS